MDKIDNLDKKILSILSKNARIPFKDVAAECGVSRAAIHQRVQRLMEEQNAQATWYCKMLKNLLLISTKKNRNLSNRIFCTTSKTVRGRLAAFFSEQATKAGSNTFDIPFNRQQMADYLNLDRSALSKELGKMREEGLLTFRKNHFSIKGF